MCDVMLSFPAILVALLIAGVGRALFRMPTSRWPWRAHPVHFAHWLGAVRTHRARLHAGGAQQGIRAGRAGHWGFALRIMRKQCCPM